MFETIVKQNLDKLKNSSYPGRGIALGLTPSGEELVQLYWTMGRSKNSKNRVMLKEDKHVTIVPYDKSLEIHNEDLIIYNVSAQIENTHIVTNGRQTDTIYKYLVNNGSFEDALYKWEYEHDAPIYTPRISGLTVADGANSRYKLSLIKAIDQNPDLLSHQFFSYNAIVPGFGHCVHTYSITHTCMPFIGEPYWLKFFDDIDESADLYWNVIPEDKRVALYIKHINVSSGEIKERIISTLNIENMNITGNTLY